MFQLSKLMQVTKVYRGPGGKLGDNYWRRDAFNLAGGVDFSFASTTHDYEIAATYARMGTARMIFECHMGLADRGAEIGWLSQYPMEKEVCLPPLTAFEVQTARKVRPVYGHRLHRMSAPPMFTRLAPNPPHYSSFGRWSRCRGITSSWSRAQRRPC